MDQSRHENTTAIVTGAGSGIGKATALRMAREGARVVACDVDDAGLAALGEELMALGCAFETVRCDVNNQGDVDALVAVAGDRVDVLANVAGVMDHFLPLGELDDAAWEQVIGVNLTGVMRLTRAVLPVMEAAGGGAVVTVASEASLGAGASGVAYAASKHGVLGIVRHVAFFYGPKAIRSNAVLPGGVETGVGATAAPRSEWAMERAMAKMATIGPIAQPDQIGAVVSWLASAEASNVNGAIVTADGGWSAA